MVLLSRDPALNLWNLSALLLKDLNGSHTGGGWNIIFFFYGHDFKTNINLDEQSLYFYMEKICLHQRQTSDVTIKTRIVIIYACTPVVTHKCLNLET